MKYRGTILGGPHDGKVVDCDHYIMRMPVYPPVEVGYWNKERTPDWRPYLIDEYRWRQDDDGRGWWVRETR